LFINSGQIGDILISSIIFDNEDTLREKFKHLIFLIRDDYKELYTNYCGKIEVQYYNYYKYKYDLIYKFRLLLTLRKRNLTHCFNLTAARGILNDELALLSGAKEISTLNSDWKYLKKMFGQKMDANYTHIIGNSKTNEYEKHFEMLIFLLKCQPLIFTNEGNNRLFFSQQTAIAAKFINEVDFRRTILIGPFSSTRTRDWSLFKLKVLVTSLSKSDFTIILLGSKNQKKLLMEIKQDFANVLVLAGELSLSEIPLIFKNAEIFLGLDSGLSHLALRVGTPTIALTGMGMYGKFFPFPLNNKKITYLYHHCEFLRCEWRCHFQEKYCVNEIPVQEVISSINDLLDSDLKF